MNYKMIRIVLGWLLIFEAAFLLVPALTAWIYGEQIGWLYLLIAGVCAVIGVLLRLGNPQSKQLSSKEGFLIVSLSWLLLSLVGALPLWLSGEISTYVDALFEAASGFTTTGASILTDVEAISHASLLWRSFTHWVGGMGILVFMLAILPLSGGQNMHIMRAESPGPSVSKLVPRVRTTALWLYCIYVGLTFLAFLLLVSTGMTGFEALNTAFATAGTGGFGIYNDSLASFAPHLQWIVAVFMVLFSVNFMSYFLLLRKKWKDVLSEEVRAFFIIVFAATAVITVNVAGQYATVGEAIRHSFFSVASIISTTGFATTDFDIWPEVCRLLLFVLMFVGACAGSTGGGIKVSRFVILFKGIGRALRCALHPREVRKVSVDAKPVEETVVHSVFIYLSVYTVVFFASVFLISFDNWDFTTNFTAVAATLNNIGPGLSRVGPTCNYAFLSNTSKLVLIFDMLAGRLELFPMLLLFHPASWKKR